MRKTLPCIVVLSLLLAGCITPKKADLSAFRVNPPRSILVVPVVNDSPEITASSIFTPSLTMPLAERGYYVFPVYLTEMLLHDLGLSEAGHIHLMPTIRFYELFGADAVLLVTIKNWSTKYVVLASSVEVSAEYVLKDTRTGTVLWQGSQRAVRASNGGSGGLIGALVAAAVHAMIADYKPLAMQANGTAFLPPHGLPAGPYHPEYGKDQSQFE
jgi:hypothetical protein